MTYRWIGEETPLWRRSPPTILAGAHLVRVHDVRPSREAAAIADAILAASI